MDARVPQPQFISRRGLIGATALVAAALAAGCTVPGAEDAASEAEARELAVGITRPWALDPFEVEGTAAEAVASLLFEPLVRYDYAAAELVGAAAWRFEVSDDALTCTFHLREQTFHTGEPVTAADFKRSWERLIDPRGAAVQALGTSPNAYRLALVQGYAELAAGDAVELSGVACPDDATLVVALTEPYAEFAHILAHPSLAAVPASADADIAAFGSSPQGAGPYAMEGSWGENSTAIRLARYEGYAAADEALPSVRFVLYPSVASAYQEFLTGTLDVAACPVDELEGAIARYGVASDGLTVAAGQRLVESARLAVSYLALNTSAAPLDDPAVRRALSLAIDREGLVRRVYRDMHLPASGIVPPRVEGYREGAWPYALNDTRQAEALLDGVRPRDEEGSRGETLSLIFAGRGGHDNAMDEIAAAWEDLGFSCEPEELEEQDFRERVRTGNFQVARLDAVSDRPTAESFLFPLFHSRSAGGGNVTGYASEEVDNLLNQARAVTGDSERMSALEQADELVAADAPVIPLTYPLQVIAAGEAADGLIIDPQGYLNVEGMTAGEE